MKPNEVAEITKDTIKAIAKSSLSFIPIAGPFFSEFLEVFVNIKSKKRFKIWAEIVETRLSLLEKEKIINEELFYSTLIKATQKIITTYQEEKMQYFSNALFNTAVSNIQ